MTDNSTGLIIFGANNEDVVPFSKARRPDGYFSITDKDTGAVSESYSAQCKHCGSHWQVVKGSGIQRGFCRNCNGKLCGHILCITECVPYIAQTEILEGKKETIAKYKHTKTYLSLLGFLL